MNTRANPKVTGLLDLPEIQQSWESINTEFTSNWFFPFCIYCCEFSIPVFPAQDGSCLYVFRFQCFEAKLTCCHHDMLNKN